MRAKIAGAASVMRRHVVNAVQIAELVGLDSFRAIGGKESFESDLWFHWLTLSDLLAVLFSHGWDIMARGFVLPLSGELVLNPAPIIAGPGRVGSGQCLQQPGDRLEPAPGGIYIGSGRGRVGI